MAVNLVDAGPNLSLRRVDWRYLLPRSRTGAHDHLVVVGGPSDIVERLARTGTARRYSRAWPAREPVDAVVLLQDACSLDMLRQAAKSLCPGGVLYGEIDRRRSWALARSGPAKLRHLLDRHSLSLTGLYWVAPGFEVATRYVPADVPAAVQWYLSVLCASGSPSARVVEAVARGLTWGSNQVLTRMLPWYAFTAVSRRDDAGAVALLGHSALPADRQQLDLRPLLVTSGQDDGSRVVVVPFARRGRQPDYVVKAARRSEFNANIENEQGVLAELRSRLNGDTQRAIPRPLGLYYEAGLAVGLEERAGGRPLVTSSGRWGASIDQQRDDLRIASLWLTQFHLQTRQDQGSEGGLAFAERTGDLCAAYLDAFAPTAAERRMLAELRERAGQLSDLPLPIVWQHNDFGPWNLIRDGDQLKVIDWELGLGPGLDHDGPALGDLLYFVTHWSYAARGLHNHEAWLRGLHDLFVEPNYDDERVLAAHQAIDAYLEVFDIDRRFLPLILIAMWVERALKRLSRRKLLGEVPGSPREGDRFVAYVNHLANRADAVFALGARPGSVGAAQS